MSANLTVKVDDQQELEILRRENEELRESRDEWKKDAQELADYLRGNGVIVKFSQDRY